MPRHNGFPYYKKGEICAHCGVECQGDPEAEPGDYPEDFGDYFLECPECYRPGCEECMPFGRGCVCPECEESE
jgi:hypothetical protein